jgi:glutamine phosphoribosylpyrophosphate amidotransferase
MGGRPALIRQRDLKQVINAARKAGAKEVELRIGDVPAIIRLSSEGEAIKASTADDELDRWQKGRGSTCESV